MTISSRVLAVGFNVSIATGEVVFAEIGHPSLVVQDIIGETVNRASILNRQISDADSGYLLCEATRERVGNGFPSG